MTEENQKEKPIRYALVLLEEKHNYRAGDVIFVSEDYNEVVKKEKEYKEKHPESVLGIIRSHKDTKAF